MEVATDAAPLRPPALAEATKKSTSTWQEDLQTLFHRDKVRFPDAVWDLVYEDSMDDSINEIIHSHKGTTFSQLLELFPVIFIHLY